MSRSLQNALLPVLTISTILGIFPLYPKKQRITPQKYTTIAIIAIYSCTALSSYYYTQNSDLIEKFNEEESRVANTALAIASVINICILYATYITSLVKTSQLKDVLLDLEKIDTVLQKLGEDKMYQFYTLYQITVLTTSFVVITVLATLQNIDLHHDNFPLNFDTQFLLLYPMVVVNVLNTQYCLYVFITWQRFFIVNKQLEKIQNLLKTNEISILKALEIFDILMKVYETLYKISENLNVIFSVQLIPIIAQQFFLFTFSIFYMYSMVHIKPLAASCWILWGLFKIWELFHSIIACHLSIREMETTGRKVHKILLKNHNFEIEQKLQIFSQQIIQSSFEYTVCGMFTLDGRLLLEMMRTCVTFVIIMIQFQATMAPTKYCIDKN